MATAAVSNEIDSDNDTQMSTQDNAIDPPADTDTDTNANKTNEDNPIINIDIASNTNNNDDDDSKMNDDNMDDTDNNNMNHNNNNNDNPPIKATDNDSNPAQPKYKYIWQWPENDGSWHDYDATTQLLLEQLLVGHKITIKSGQWNYDITKISADSCQQLNLQTTNSRTSRRNKIAIVPPPNIKQDGTNDWITSNNARYAFMWQFLENNNKWIDLQFNVAVKLEALPLNGSTKYSFGKWSYTVYKCSMDECTQTNENTSNQRDLRRILYDTVTQKRVVWQYQNDKGGWNGIDENDLMLQLLDLSTGQTMNHVRGKWNYVIAKIDDTHATQTNSSTHKVRHYRMIEQDKDTIDSGWSSKASTNNQNYLAAYQSNNAYGGYYQSNQFRGLFANLVAADDAKPNEIVKLDPNDVQDIIMNAEHTENNDEDESNHNKKQVEDLEDNKDEDEEDAKKTERVLMGEDDRNIYNEFCVTLSKDSVQVLSIQKIKDNASKSIVYNALLTAKNEELKDKNVQNIERVLFHGTSFGNIAKIVNNGFNRDFNRHHLYGKGTYFSSLSSEAAKYCENDDENDAEKHVMLVCRVIIGEYTKGTHSMDGSSIPYKPDKKTQYESCVNNVESPTIFVINRDYHAIPTHIITFKYKQ